MTAQVIDLDEHPFLSLKTPAYAIYWERSYNPIAVDATARGALEQARRALSTEGFLDWSDENIWWEFMPASADALVAWHLDGGVTFGFVDDDNDTVIVVSEAEAEAAMDWVDAAAAAAERAAKAAERAAAAERGEYEQVSLL